jgi:nucleotide-binding universal stress UspA family protein
MEVAHAMLPSNGRRSDQCQRLNRPRKKVLVVGVDFSEFGDAALRDAHELARLQPDAVVHVVHVVSLHAAMSEDDALLASPPDIDHRGHDLSNHVRKTLRSLDDGSPPVTTHLRVGDPAREIAQFAVDLDADAIVVGTHGRRGFARLVLGSVAERVLRYATCPVLVVCPKRHHVEEALPPDIRPALLATATENQRPTWTRQYETPR